MNPAVQKPRLMAAWEDLSDDGADGDADYDNDDGERGSGNHMHKNDDSDANSNDLHYDYDEDGIENGGGGDDNEYSDDVDDVRNGIASPGRLEPIFPQYSLEWMCFNASHGCQKDCCQRQ